MSANSQNLVSKLGKQFDRTTALFKVLGLEPSQANVQLRDCYIKQLPDMVKSWGIRETVKYLKGTYNFYTKYACKRECSGMELPKWSKVDRFGAPKRYKPFTLAINKGNSLLTRYILTLLRSYEVLELEPEIDTYDIENETGAAEGYETFRKDFNLFLRTNDLTQGIKATFNKELVKEGEKYDGQIPFHTTTKSGTEGPAMANLHHQSLAITGEVRDCLEKIASIVHKEPLGPILDTNQKIGNALKGQDLFKVKTVTGLAKTALGAISFIPDKGGKTRVVAKGNYWVQNTLLPIHRVLYATLRTIAQDGTYRQSEIFESLMRLSETMEVWSSDLTNATTLWTMVMQSDSMKFLHSELGVNWSRLFSLLTFHFGGRFLSFKVGGPMGIYSNWGAFTITHHFLVLYAFSLSKQWNEKMHYGMIGDDNALANELAAMSYRGLLETIKVKLNKLKTWDPKGSKTGHSSFEFAKRYSLDGQELTALPPGIVNSGFQSLYNIPEVVNFLVKHGYAEILNAPLEEIAICYNVWQSNKKNLFVAFHVSGLLGSQYAVNSIEDNLRLDPGVEGITLRVILEYRLERLMKNILKTADTKGAVAQRTQDLLTRLGIVLSPSEAENSAIIRIFNTQKADQSELQYKMAFAIFTKARSEALGLLDNDLELKLLKKVEYLTPVSFKELEDGITNRLEPIHSRGKVLKELVKRTLSLRGK